MRDDKTSSPTFRASKWFQWKEGEPREGGGRESEVRRERDKKTGNVRKERGRVKLDRRFGSGGSFVLV